MYGCESWTIKKAQYHRIDVFKLWCWRRLTRAPWAAKRLNQSILKEISPEYSLEGLMLKLKFQSFGHLMGRADRMKRPGKDWRQQEKGTTEDEMVGWHHWLDGHEFEQALGDGDGQGSLACCSPWGHKESVMTGSTELNWTEHCRYTESSSQQIASPPILKFGLDSTEERTVNYIYSPSSILGEVNVA